MSDQYSIPMIQNALNFHGFGFPDKHTECAMNDWIDTMEV